MTTLAIQPRTTVKPWWKCPTWCTDCTGGATHTFDDGLQIVMSRIHRHVIWQDEAQSADLPNTTVQVALVREQIEDPDGRPLPEQMLHVVGDTTIICDQHMAALFGR